MAARPGSQGGRRVPEDTRCEAHREPLRLFCDDDQTLLCGRCRAQQHDGHAVYGVQEAAGGYRVRLPRAPLAARPEERAAAVPDRPLGPGCPRGRTRPWETAFGAGLSPRAVGRPLQGENCSGCVQPPLDQHPGSVSPQRLFQELLNASREKLGVAESMLADERDRMATVQVSARVPAEQGSPAVSDGTGRRSRQVTEQGRTWNPYVPSVRFFTRLVSKGLGTR